MYENMIYILHGIFVLLFGVVLSMAFSGLHLSRKNMLLGLATSVISGVMQVVFLILFSMGAVWKFYPLIAHVPVFLMLCLVCRKRVVTALTSLFTAYLFCQPSKWFGVLLYYLTQSSMAEYIARIVLLILVAFLALQYLAPYFSEIFNKDTRSVCIFGLVPAVYYVYDYGTTVYADLWVGSNRVVAEFLPFFLCLVFAIFCFVYYKEYEQKADAERWAQLVRIATEQQEKEIAAARRSEQEMSYLRHDMRHFLEGLSVSLEQEDLETARTMIRGISEMVEKTAIRHYCANDVINYLLSGFAAKCQERQVPFVAQVELRDFRMDEVLFASILSNALDNALNAQMELDPSERRITLMLTDSGRKLLLSVKNPYKTEPTFVDGMPLSRKKGHGYGTRSIRHMTERLGGNCQFSVEDRKFVLRVVIAMKKEEAL